MAAALRNRANQFVAPQKQIVPLTTQVDSKAVLNYNQPGKPNIRAIGENGRYALPQSSQTVTFPSPLIPYDQDEVYWRNRQQVLTQATRNQTNKSIIPGAGKVYLDSKYWEFAQKEREKEVARMFEEFVYSQINLSTPEKRQYWESRFPEYTENAYRSIEKQKELELKLSKIAIRGFKTRDDFLLKFMYDKGLLTGYTGENYSVFDQEWLFQNYQNMPAQIGLPQGDPATNDIPFPVNGIHTEKPAGEVTTIPVAPTVDANNLNE